LLFVSFGRLILGLLGFHSYRWIFLYGRRGLRRLLLGTAAPAAEASENLGEQRLPGEQWLYVLLI